MSKMIALHSVPTSLESGLYTGRDTRGIKYCLCAHHWRKTEGFPQGGSQRAPDDDITHLQAEEFQSIILVSWEEGNKTTQFYSVAH